jgi:hypothetical protein
MKTTKQIYCQFLLNTQTNYTCTYLADHFQHLDENSIYRYLKSEKLTPRLVWEKATSVIEYNPNGYLIFDDTIINKDFSTKIDGVRTQYSGNAHDIIKGIGVVTCLYYNPELDKYWIVDFRIFDPDKDGKSKLDHVRDMLTNIAHSDSRKQLFDGIQIVLMDTWYATTEMMLLIDRDYHKIYYCPIKSNRRVDDSSGQKDYQLAKDLVWTTVEKHKGKLVKIKKFPGSYKHRLFRVVISNGKTELIVTNDLSQDSTIEAQKESANRWKIEQLHRESKGNTGLEKCQCRGNRSQRNHICCAFLVWHCLTEKARQIGLNIYQVKERILSDYMVKEMRNPSVVFG